MSTTAELLTAAEGVPWLAGTVLVLGTVSWAVERIAGLSGPATALTRAWSDRELRKLRREALLRAERRKLAAEEEAGRIADLSAQLSELRTEVTWMRAERDERRRADTAERHRRERYDRVLTDYVWALLNAARAAGVPFASPPLPPGPATNPEGRNPAQAIPSPR